MAMRGLRKVRARLNFPMGEVVRTLPGRRAAWESPARHWPRLWRPGLYDKFGHSADADAYAEGPPRELAQLCTLLRVSDYLYCCLFAADWTERYGSRRRNCLEIYKEIEFRHCNCVRSRPHGRCSNYVDKRKRLLAKIIN